MTVTVEISDEAAKAIESRQGKSVAEFLAACVCAEAENAFSDADRTVAEEQIKAETAKKVSGCVKVSKEK